MPAVRRPRLPNLECIVCGGCSWGCYAGCLRSLRRWSNTWSRLIGIQSCAWKLQRRRRPSSIRQGAFIRRTAHDATVAGARSKARPFGQRLLFGRARGPCGWNRLLSAIGLVLDAVLAVRNGKRAQVVGVSRAEGCFSSVVVPVDVRVLGRGVKRRGFEGIGATFAEAGRLVYGAEGAVDGLELLLACLQRR
jgi:hypothetical protein